MRLYDILARVHEDQLYMPTAYQILPQRLGVEPSHRKLSFGYRVVYSAPYLLG